MSEVIPPKAIWMCTNSHSAGKTHRALCDLIKTMGPEVKVKVTSYDIEALQVEADLLAKELEDYRFTSDDEEEYNNTDVINALNRYKKFKEQL